MGVILGKFRKKKSTLEILENVEKEIKSIEEFRRDTEQAQKRIVGRFVVISVGAYLFTAFIFYFHFFPADFYDQLFYIIPLIFAPVIIITVKRGLTWYYKRKISRKQSKLFALREEKKKLLDQVKETETYKVAKTILDKYAPESQVVARRSMGVLVNDNGKTPMKLETPALHDTVLRQRALPAPLPPQMSSTFVTPYRPLVQHSALLPMQAVSNLPSSAKVIQTSTPLPRGILPRDRSVFDKIVDYLVGDGPSNRFALICKNCYSHNGMAHKDEFEYVSFRCCYCMAMNLARKKRPDGPKLEFDTKLLSSQTYSEASESEKNSPSESETESEVSERTEIETAIPSEQPMEVDEIESTMTVVKEIVDDSVPTVESFSEPMESKELPPIDLKD